MPPLPPGIQLVIYRLVQEALTNTLKHAVDAESATVRLRFDDGRLEVDVTDNGRPSASASLSGHGITGMRERAALYGGTVTNSLTLAAQLIRSPLAPRVIYITGVGDFDFHEGHNPHDLLATRPALEQGACFRTPGSQGS